jgi:hypothetical protein
VTVYTYSRIPAFNPNTSPSSVAKSATGAVYDKGDTGFLTPLNITLVVGNVATTTLISDANGMFPDFTLLDRVSVVFKSGSISFVLTTSDPVPGPKGDTGAASTVPGPPTTDASLLTAGTVADARLPVRLSDASLSATYVAGVSLSPTNNSGSAIANVAALNSAITAANAAGGGRVLVKTPGVYQLSGSVLMKSYVTLDIAPGVTLRKLDAAPAVCMIRNANVTDVKPYTDTHISVIGGGIIDCNPDNNPTRPGYSDPAPAPGTLQYGIVGDMSFYGVSNLLVSGIRFLGGHGSCIQMMGDDLTISRIDIYTPGDGFHVNGPSKRVKFSQITGTALDDFIALLPWDWARTGPTVGDIEDVSIDECTYLGAGILGPAGSAAIKMVPGTRASGYGAGTGALRNVRVTGLNFTGGSGVQMQSEFDQIVGSHSGAGTVENVRFSGGKWAVDVDSISPFNIRKLTSGGTPADGQTSLTVRNVTFEGVHFNSTTNVNSPTAIGVGYSYTGLSMQGVVFRDCAWTPKTAGGGAFANIISKTPVQGIDIDGLLILGNMSAGACVLTINNTTTGAVTTLQKALLRRLRTAPGVTVDAPMVSLSGVLEKLVGSDWDLQHTGGSGDDHGIQFSSANAFLTAAFLTNCIMRNAKTMLRVGNGATGSVIAKMVLTDCDLISVTHPVFITGNRQADVTFVGGNIDTAGNLARVDGSTLTLTLDRTTSSGAGATTITPVSTVTIRVPLSNKIALPLNTLTLTEQDGDYVKSSATPAVVVSGTGAGTYIYRGGAGFVKLN